MTPGELYDRFRSNVVDEVQPYLWSDDDVWGYMDDAQKMLCRLTEGIRDASSSAAQCVVTSGEAFAPLHSSVLLIRGVTVRSTGKKIRVYSYEELYGANAPAYTSDYGCSTFTPAFMARPGPIIAAVIGMEEGKLRLVQVPTADDNLDLVIERLPLKRLTEATAQFEVREEHHEALLLWMEHLAFKKNDSETKNDALSQQRALEFRAYCAQAKEEKARRNHKPRLIAYGGL